MQTKVSRRQILGSVLLSTVLMPVRQSEAAAQKLTPTDPQAAALGYVEDAKKVDVKRFPTYKSGQTCDNCMSVQLRYGFFRPCKPFPGKLVSAKGWCSAWAVRTFQK